MVEGESRCIKSDVTQPPYHLALPAQLTLLRLWCLHAFIDCVCTSPPRVAGAACVTPQSKARDPQVFVLRTRRPWRASLLAAARMELVACDPTLSCMLSSPF